ncbi:MAG: phosphoribosylglycinamide formyltransferase [Alphaproteobacteria bacterium]|nr:phosphoribosylglycinamide formyltransferase [Alphaproteobacteria bacterium]
MNIGFLASHNGSSSLAITDACLAGELMASPTVMISNNSESKALEWAENRGLKTFCMNSKTHLEAKDLDQAMAQKLQDHKINLVVCSGYMKLIGPETLRIFENKILNIHPSLLPKYGGAGMYGRKIHEAVKQNGDAQTGITIHLVDTQYDTGKILAQKVIDLLPEDDVSNIEEKVKQAEPEFYIETIRKIIKGDIVL